MGTYSLSLTWSRGRDNLCMLIFFIQRNYRLNILSRLSANGDSPLPSAAVPIFGRSNCPPTDIYLCGYPPRCAHRRFTSSTISPYLPHQPFRSIRESIIPLWKSGFCSSRPWTWWSERRTHAFISSPKSFILPLTPLFLAFPSPFPHHVHGNDSLACDHQSKIHTIPLHPHHIPSCSSRCYVEDTVNHLLSTSYCILSTAYRQ